MIVTRDSFIRRCGLTEEFLRSTEELYKVPGNLLLGLIRTESRGMPGVMRYERKYKWLHQPHLWAKKYGWTEETEEQLQKFSYGLAQLMGATARDNGFDSHFFRLLEPTIGASWGASHLFSLFKRYGSWDDAISAYNQGTPKRNRFTGRYRNQNYVDKVRQAEREFNGAKSNGPTDSV